MAKLWNYDESKKKIIIEPPKQRLRITGHRMASVLGLNKYQSKFGAWAEITKLVRLPFEDNKYTLAGKAIEPKLIKYISNILPNTMSIEEYYGNNIEKYRWNNFVDDSDIFGGIIDAVSTLNDKKTITAIVECKTSSKPQEWVNGNVPIEYLLQGAEYAKLKGLDRIVFICAFLQEEDYNHPEEFIPTEKNTIITIKKLSDIIVEIDGVLCNIDDIFNMCEEWWHNHIDTGISPEFDEKQDKEYLQIIRATDETKDNDLIAVCEEAYNINLEIKRLKEEVRIDELEKRLKSLETSIKNKMIEDDISSCGDYKLTKSVKQKFNEKLFADENEKLYNKYIETTESYILSKNKKKDEEGE